LPRVAGRPIPWFVVASLAVACGAPESTRTDAPSTVEGSPIERPRVVGELAGRSEARPPVVVIGLDGADWQHLEPLLEAGELPNLARLRERSAWGVLRTETPSLSPLLWTSMLTGVSPVEHGILDFSRFRPGSGVREPITSDERRRPAIWNELTWAGKRVDVLGLWATHPAEAVSGVLVSDRLFGFLNVEAEPPPGAVYPPGEAAWARERLRAAWSDVGLAELRAYLPDVQAAELEGGEASGRPYEDPVTALRRVLVETRLYAGLAEERLESSPAPDLMVVYLQGTDSIGHLFAPFAPPRAPEVSEPDYRRYRDVPRRYFREVDDWIGRWTAAADRIDASILVVSDHGFLWGEGRPERLSSNDNATAARWHRAEGIWLLRAPGVTAGRSAEAGLRQVYPTLLALTGLPADTTGESRPLGGIDAPGGPPYDYGRVFAELRDRRAGAPPAAASSGADAEALAELRALGYLGGSESATAPEAARADGSSRTGGSWNNEGIVLRGEGRDDAARRAFERAIELDPGLASALWNLSDLLHAAGELDRSDELLGRALEHDLPEGPRLVIGRAIGYQRAGDLARSLALVDRAVSARPQIAELRLFRGRYRIESGSCRGALDDFLAAEAIAPGDAAAAASEGLARLCLEEPEAAVEALRRSLAIDPDQPRVRAMLARLGDTG